MTYTHPSGTIVTINKQEENTSSSSSLSSSSEATKRHMMSQQMQPSSTNNTQISSIDSYQGTNSSTADDLSAKDVSMADLQREQSLDYSSRRCSAQYIEDASSNERGSSSSSSASSTPGQQSTSTTPMQLGRRSTLIFDDNMDEDMPVLSHNEDADDDGKLQQQQQEQLQQRLQQEQLVQQQQQRLPQQPPQPILVPTIFKWTEGGSKVFVMGTFTGWRKMIALNGPSPTDGSFSVQIALPPGMHRFKFVVDNEVKCSNFIPTATDTSGHFVNYLEIIPSEKELYPELNRTSSKASLKSTGSKLGLTKDDDDMGNGYTRYHEDLKPVSRKNAEYTNLIPPIFTDPKVMEEYYVTLDNSQKSGGHNQQWLIPPQLPPHLENVILNSYNSNDKENTSGALGIPNHVVLNHLATTSIKHSTLAVACVIRYKRKYVTQILYAPLQ
ncbi:hypothetical protein FOA43_004506 [Brettanomyces nanus]|uniref:Association with the SNF1 complex (ASC) domain-containing protein n=1 Tax=Eeniella nana TaxID=13502 RepID=A0A875S884_EENNA|nr:uncharacterized protein FOA43_004506 [Brettanomyces nanus]QPG77103.1 hypothetical protein FOA43_004506 [Brettanomyces nanus]